MNTKKGYFLLILLITLLTYHQSIGLNVSLISLISIGYLSQSSLKQKPLKWWIAAVIWFFSGLGLFLSETTIGGILFIITGLNFISLNANNNHSFPFSIAGSIVSFIMGFGKFFMLKKKSIADTDNLPHNSKSVVKKLLLISVPILIILIFLKLYQSASPEFAELTAFINLNFIKVTFIIYYAFSILYLYGIYHFQSTPSITNFDIKTKNLIPKHYTDKLQAFIGIASEHKLTVSLLVTLNFLLITFIAVDAYTLFSNIETEGTHSQNVHQGINILIASILLVILIIAYVFRGGLNFVKNKLILSLAGTWLFLNLVVTIFNAIKNLHYIQEWGFTHKRIGVFIYLFLCIIGLAFTFYKVFYKKSFWYLIRNISYSFTGILVLYSLFNWNSIIAHYNLNGERFSVDKIDFNYNLRLGTEAYPAIIDFLAENPEYDKSYHMNLTYSVHNYLEKIDAKNWTDFPSEKLSELLIREKLRQYYTQSFDK